MEMHPSELEFAVLTDWKGRVLTDEHKFSCHFPLPNIFSCLLQGKVQEWVQSWFTFNQGWEKLGNLFKVTPPVSVGGSEPTFLSPSLLSSCLFLLFGPSFNLSSPLFSPVSTSYFWTFLRVRRINLSEALLFFQNILTPQTIFPTSTFSPFESSL